MVKLKAAIRYRRKQYCSTVHEDTVKYNFIHVMPMAFPPESRIFIHKHIHLKIKNWGNFLFEV